MDKNTAVIILAAGKGTRMKSDKAKVLHELNGKPMILYVVDTASKIADNNVIVVIGHQREFVQDVVSLHANTKFAVQDNQNGTGHAVMCALPYLENSIDNVVILCGDVPLITHSTLLSLINHHNTKRVMVTVLAVEVDNPFGYGRMVTDRAGNLLKIVEEADANSDEKKIRLVNTGIYCINKKFLENSLSEINHNNAQGEMYLTDIVEIANNKKEPITMSISGDCAEVIGVNTCADLEMAQSLLDLRKT